MSSITWTASQQKAITARGVNLLVAAAAGAGKTAVLIERIVGALKSGQLDLSRLLVVTFTEAAAGEMRQRLNKVLTEALHSQPDHPHLQKQVYRLPRAQIGTLHSFCNEIVRRYFYLLGLDPGFRIMEENEAEMFRRDVLAAVLEKIYDEKADAPSHDPFLYLCRALSGRHGDDHLLMEITLRLYDYARSLPRPRAWLRWLVASLAEAPHRSWEEQPWWEEWWTLLRLQLQAGLEKIKTARRLAARPEGPQKYLTVLEADRQKWEGLLAKVGGSYEELRAILSAVTWDKLPSIKKGEADADLKEQVQKLRGEAKGIIKSLQEKWFSRSTGEWLAEISRAALPVQALVDITLRFDEAYRQQKMEQAVADFADLEHYTLALLAVNAELSPWGVEPPSDPEAALTPSPVALELRRQLDEVLVDEYQDINGIQEAILQLISPPQGRFMVGDVKQSIYRFRRADPAVFLERYNAYAELSEEDLKGGVAASRGQPVGAKESNATGRDAAGAVPLGFKIDLRENFRSRPEILATVNFLFRSIMTAGVGELAYDERASLCPGFTYPPSESGRAGGPVEFHLLELGALSEAAATAEQEGEEGDIEELETGGEDNLSDVILSTEELDATRLEARWVAERIWRLVQEEERVVYDRALGGYRPLTWRDVVILLRSPRPRVSVFLQEMQRRGIPAYADGGGGYFAAPEVQVMLALLRLIDNPRQDIPLAAVLRSPLVGLKASELAVIRLASPEGDFYTAVERVVRGQAMVEKELAERLQSFWRQLENWRDLARFMPPAELLEELYRQTGYYDLVGALPAGTVRQANLRALIDRARQFAGTIYRGLFRFLRYIERYQAEGGDMDLARSLAEGENVVRVMSIHRSKGLEFPVVVVTGLGNQFNFQDLNGDFLWHRRLGCGPKLFDLERGLVYPTLLHQLIRERLRREMLAEEMRLLYVAFTRARELLLATATVRGLDRALSSWRMVAEGLSADQSLPEPYLAGARSFLDWLVPSLCKHPAVRDGDGAIIEAGDWQLHLHDQGELQPLRQSLLVDGIKEVDENTAGLLQELAPYPEEKLQLLEAELCCAGEETISTEELKEHLFWQGPCHFLSTLPAKVTVTEWQHRWEEMVYGEEKTITIEEVLSGEVLLGGEGQGAASDKKLSFPLEAAVILPPGFDLPQLLSGRRVDSTARGRAVHLLMQKLDLSMPLDRDGIGRQIEDMVSRQLLLPEEAELIEVEEVVCFFATDLGRRIIAAASRGRLWREVPFTVGLAAKELYPEIMMQLPPECLQGETILVQGVIDCLWEEDDRLFILDYKTDRLRNEDLPAAADRYRLQLELYARAVEKILNRPVTKRLIYFLVPRKAVAV